MIKISQNTRNKINCVKEKIKSHIKSSHIKNIKYIYKRAGQDYVGLKVGDILVAKLKGSSIQNHNKATKKFIVLDIEETTEILIAGEITLPNKIHGVFPLIKTSDDGLYQGSNISFREGDLVAVGMGYLSVSAFNFELDTDAVFHSILDQEGIYDPLEKIVKNNSLAKEIKKHNQENRLLPTYPKVKDIFEFVSQLKTGDTMWRSAKNCLTVESVTKKEISNQEDYVYRDYDYSSHRVTYIAPNDFIVKFKDLKTTWSLEDFQNKSLFKNPPRSRKEIEQS